MKLTDFAEVIKIEKGWSHEQKYKVTNADGKSFLLRITPIEQYEYKKAEFENMKMVSELEIPMCLPIEFGTCEDEIEVMRKQAKNILDWYDDMRNTVPKWYSK